MEERTVAKLIGIAGLLMIVGFFTRWFDGGGFFPSFSGLDVARMTGSWDRYALFAIPVGGAFMIYGAFKNPMYARRAAFFTGVFILGYGVYSVARVVLDIFQHAAGFGLWLVAIGALIALVLPLIVKQKRA
jgi:hypothetical protein